MEKLRQEFANPGADYRALEMSYEYDKPEEHAKWLTEGKWGGAHFGYPHGGPTYLQDQGGWDKFLASLEACKRNNLNVWIYDEWGYPSGRAGGLTLQDHPEYEAQGLFYDATDMAPKEATDIEWRVPEGKPYYVALCHLNWAGQISGDSIEVTDKIKDGVLRTKLEPGEWRLVAFVQNRLFEGTHGSITFGPMPNLMDPDAIKRFIEVGYEPFYSRCGNDFGKSIKAIFTDEPSLMTGYLKLGKQPYPAVPWYHGLPDVFKQRAGYDIKRVLPALFNDTDYGTAKLRCDFYSTVAQTVADSYFGQIADWCEAHKVAFTGHLVWEESLIYHANFYGSIFPSLSRMTWPGIDVLGCNYGCTSGARTEGGPVTPKLISSAAHIYNKKRTISESFCFVTNKTPVDDLLAHVAWQETMGINTITTLSVQQQFPPEVFRRINDYTGRLSQMLTQGKPVVDVAVLYPIASVWADFVPTDRHVSSLSDNPKAKDVDDAWREVSKSVLGCQRDFDYVAEESLESAKISSGKLKIGGGEYSILVLPHVTTLKLPALQKITEFAAKGGMVISFGSVPVNREDAGSVDEFHQLVDELWDPGAKRKGRVIHCATMKNFESALRGLDGADVRVSPKTSDIYYSHRALSDGDIYFVLNNAQGPVSGRFEFRAAGKAQLWDPVTGEIKPLSAKRVGDTSRIELTLPRRNGVFVVFDK